MTGPSLSDVLAMAAAAVSVSAAASAAMQGTEAASVLEYDRSSGPVTTSAADLVTTSRVTSDGATEWARAGRVFATLDAGGSRAAFRLDPLLASAARRTPDTDVSARGPDWVEFHPAVLDDHAIDRAVAWFEAAARRAG